MWKKISLGIIIFCVIFVVEAKIPLMDQDIGGAIFHQAKPYLIYVCNEQQDKYLKPFEEYCGDTQFCTILDKTVQMHSMFREFVSMDVDDYILILDATQLHKYTMPLDDSFTKQTLSAFHERWSLGEQPRFFTSQKIPQQIDDPSRKPYLRPVVGLNFADFYKGPQIIKVLFLYSDDQGCSNCKDVYDITVDASKKFPDRQKIAFASLDPFRNEHELLQQVEIPVVLIYVGEKKIRLVQMQEIKQMEQRIQEELKAITLPNQEL